MPGRTGVASNKAFLFWMALAGFVLYCAPITPTTPAIARAAFASPSIAMTGPSVIRHFSKCDADRRSIAAMLAGLRGKPVLDLSEPGQSFAQSTNLAAISLRNPHVRTLLLTISVFALMEENVISLRDYIVFRLLNPALAAETLNSRLFGRDDQSGLYGPLQDAFAYGGIVYPDYSQMKTRFLAPEREATTCPEADGINRPFMTAMYHHTYQEYPILPGNLALIDDLGREARARGKELWVVLLPIDSDLMQSLVPADVAPVRARVQELSHRIAAVGTGVLDLSGAVRNDEFSDRWCACGHLLEAGRHLVAERMDAILAAGPIAAAAAAD